MYIQLLWAYFSDEGKSDQSRAERANCVLLFSLKLKDFQKFDSAAIALEQTAALVEGKVTPRLSGLLDSIKDEKKVSLAVADPKLGKMCTGSQIYKLLVDHIHSQCH